MATRCSQALCVLFAICLAGGSASAGAPAIAYYPPADPDAYPGEKEGGEIIIYDSEFCDETIANECRLVTLSCNDPFGRGLTISLDGLETTDVVRWMTDEEDMLLRMRGLKAEGEPALGQIVTNEMDGTWSVQFYAPYMQDPGLTLDTPLTTLAFETFVDSVTLKVDDKGRASLEDFIQSCASE